MLSQYDLFIIFEIECKQQFCIQY